MLVALMMVLCCEQVSAPEIAALVDTLGQQDSGKRAAVTYPVNSPDPKPRFLPYGTQRMRHYSFL